MRAFGVSSLALEMLTDPSEPTQSSWLWLGQELEQELPTTGAPYIAAREAGVIDLSPSGWTMCEARGEVLQNGSTTRTPCEAATGDSINTELWDIEIAII